VGNLLIWDREGEAPNFAGIRLLWRAFNSDCSVDIVSLPEFIEKNADNLKAIYLAWVYDLGQTGIGCARIIDQLRVRNGLSYWWMTLLTEKCNYIKSPQIDEAIRLLAFVKWEASQCVNGIELVSADPILAKILGNWCKTAGKPFIWRSFSARPTSSSWKRRLLTLIPFPIIALAWLAKYVYQRWPLRGVGLNKWRKTNASLTFVSYLDNLSPNSVRSWEYESGYWANLPDLLKRDRCDTNWLHIYVRSDSLPNAQCAATAIKNFNLTARKSQTHVTIDSFLSGYIVFRTLIDWIKLIVASRGIEDVLRVNPYYGIDLFLLFTSEWRSSIRGHIAISNLLYLNLLENAFGLLPRQKVGVYLQENQGWEFSLIHLWKQAGHNSLVGCPHSTVRFWDLRYFFDPRTFVQVDGCSLPMPHFVAVNGEAAYMSYRAGGYPEGDLVGVEALRYLHIDATKRKSTSPVKRNNSVLRLLVLGDYLGRNTRVQMNMLVEAVKRITVRLDITVKPHPNQPILSGDYPGFQFKVDFGPLEKLLLECDVAYASAGTSAAVEAHLCGVPTVCVLDASTLNLSPLRMRPGVFFVSGAKSLAHFLALTLKQNDAMSQSELFFTIDKQLFRWRRLLLSR